jgi:alkanesulfonate monooxygenase SsuD/methylene tetrahydromethanopterin reductase-like flavin-dependent oxidoreductase (luciferase family)
MRFGVYVPTSGEYEVPALVELARDAESVGWDGFFIWDNILATFDGSGVLADTTVALTAIALATERMRFGALVTPMARRRPWKLAKETATLDRLSDGRLVVGAGLGGTWDFAPVGELETGPRRAAILDETLDVLTALWSGRPISRRGEFFALDEARMLPTPVQRPRIPIWVAGYWPGRAPFRRAARWDGVAPLRAGALFQQLTPEELHDCVDAVGAHRRVSAPFDVVFFHTSRGRGAARVPEYADAGATWWLESTSPLEESLNEFRRRLHAGPPAG